MAEADGTPTAPRPPVLILAPLADDGTALAREVEAAGLAARCLADGAELVSIMEQDGPEAALFVVIGHEGAGSAVGEALCRLHQSEPVWARLPVLFLITGAQRLPPACAILKQSEAAPHFLCLERPVQRAVLRQMFQTLAESRGRQFRTRDLMERLRKEEARNALLLSELRHRVRNSLTVLQSLFKMTLRKADSLSELEETFGSRLRNLTDAHMRLTGSRDRSQTLETVLREQVGPYAATPDQLRLDGGPVELSGKVAFDLEIIIHELATNAAKYGALSTEAGTVTVSWATDPASGALDLSWRESGGPAVDPPERRGLGSTLITNLLSRDAAPPEVSFNRDGLVWNARISSGDFRQAR